ncbi:MULTISPECIES: zinc ribbon domain-containing protein [Geobacillus]|uniref:zinc ribbon domain-containing protein n=1 Tax=Geobacillus TaxID=129337 RepID=UPI0009E07411|nr:zinc ribbon domain-containing protein [Geobacillus genomosp. 3]
MVESPHLLVDRSRFSSSKTCSCYGRVKASLSLSERTFRCDCRLVADRDVNDAIDIK